MTKAPTGRDNCGRPFGALVFLRPGSQGDALGWLVRAPLVLHAGHIPAHPRLANTPRTRHKAGVKDGHTTHGESSFGKKLWCVLIVLFLGGIGWQVWKLNAYNNAVREAKEAGFTWECEDTLSLIKQDWHNALKKETWGEHPRVLEMRKVPDIGRYREMLHHLNPTELYATKCKDENVDALKGLSALQTLDLGGSTALQNVDALKGLTGLQELGLVNCKALKSVDALKGLTDLQKLYLTDSDELQNVDALKRLTALQTLALSTCTALQNVDGLKGLTTLQRLYLDRCPALQNVDALKGLTSLQDLDLYRCYKIPAAALRELRAALPKTIITFPDGSISPPQ